MKAALPPEAAGEPVGVRFRDEARVGRRGTLARSWARRGTRPGRPGIVAAPGPACSALPGPLAL